MGDPGGAIAHTFAAGLGGMRSAGDLVSRIQLGKKMRVSDSKKYVMDKLGIGEENLTDECFMREFREEHGLGVVTGVAGLPYGIEAKFNIEDILDIEIASCSRMRDFAKLHR